MADDGELERRAVDELLRETGRARVRAETMGPAGWMKCPLRGTNKRFLLNTLRSSGLQHRSVGQPTAGQSAAGGRQRGDWRSWDRSRSRTPPQDSRDSGSHRDRKRHHTDHGDRGDARRDQEKDGSKGLKERLHREQRHGKDGHNTDPETHRLHSRESSPGEGHHSSRSHSLSKERCHSHLNGDSSSSNSSQSSGHDAPQRSQHRNRTHSHSPASDMPTGRSQK